MAAFTTPAVLLGEEHLYLLVAACCRQELPEDAHRLTRTKQRLLTPIQVVHGPLEFPDADTELPSRRNYMTVEVLCWHPGTFFGGGEHS